MTEKDVANEAEQLLSGLYNLETTPEKMKAIVESGLPWKFQITEFSKPDPGAETPHSDKVIELLDEEIALWNTQVDEPSLVTSVDLLVAKKAPLNEEEVIEYASKHIDSGAAASAVIALASDGEKFQKKTYKKSKEFDPVIRDIVIQWSKSHGIDTVNTHLEYIPGAIMNAREKEITTLLNKIAEEKVKADHARMARVAEEWRANDAKLRAAQRLV